MTACYWVQQQLNLKHNLQPDIHLHDVISYFKTTSHCKHL